MCGRLMDWQQFEDAAPVFPAPAHAEGAGGGNWFRPTDDEGTLMSTIERTAAAPEREAEYQRLILQLEQAQRDGIFATERIERLEAELANARDALRTAITATDAIRRELRRITEQREEAHHV